MNIDISGLDKAKVLHALYHNSQCLGMGFLQAKDEFSLEDAEKALKESTYFDYLHGRVMKIRLDSDELNPALYDRDNGQGAALRAISSLK